MKISRLRLLGFKSFVEPTELVIPQGLTGVVGPNGCGKSNLLEDAATGARSPALVRAGQIGEIVNAKPEQRRRILEDAAGIAGLHSRRHEAELRLKATEANLARLTDVLGQLNSQVESLKR